MYVRLLGTMLALALVASVAVAQGGGRGQGGGQGGFQRGAGQFGMGQGPAQLVQRTDVQNELQLTDRQRTQLREKLAELQPARGGGGGGQGFGGGQRGGGGGGQDMQEQMRQRNQAIVNAIKEVLNDSQFNRFNELWIQFEGTRALNRPEVATAVGLTEAQQRQIQQIQRESMESMRDGFGGGMDREAMQAQMERVRQETDRKVLAVLNDAQRAKFTELQGRPFRFEGR